MAECANQAMDTGGTTEEPPASMERTLSVTDMSQVQLMQEKEEMLRNLDMDPYDEDQAELRFLYSKPTCFIVVGKPGSGKTTLAQRLAQEWKCQLVNATEVIQQAIDMQTEMGVKAQEILMRGEAIPESMAAKFLEEKINSPEVAHHGYILDDFPSLSEDYLSVKDQVELIKNWKLKPDFIINIKVPDKDLETRRIGQRIDPVTGMIYTQEIYDPDKPTQNGGEEGEGEEEEEEEEEMEEEQEVTGLTELPPEVIERMVKRPEDLPSYVEDNIKVYKSNILRILEDYMADHDQQYLIELDGNKGSLILHKELMSRLACFVLRPAAIPIRLQDGEEEELPDEIDTDDLLRSLAPKQMVAPRHRWRRSKWGRYCPVSLAEGNLLLGKPEFGVSFLDKMYVLSCEEAVGKFMKNPRQYLLPPQPRPPVKLVVTGPPLSGKTSLCHLLAQKYSANVLDMDEIIRPKIEEERAKMLQQVRDEAVENAIVTVKQRIKEQMEAEAAQKEETTEEEHPAPEEKEAEESEESPEKAPGEESILEEGEEEKSEEAMTAGTDESSKETESAKPPTDEDTLLEDQDEKVAEPSETTVTDGEKSTEFTVEIDAFHPDVVTMVELAIETAKDNEVTLAPETYIDVMEEAISEAEKSMRSKSTNGPLNGGWILDNFPKTRDQWNVMLERGITIDDIIVLRDESENGDFLVKRWYYLNKKQIDQKISERKAFEVEEQKRKEEEERLRKEEEKRQEEEAARKAREEERQKKIDAGEEVSDEDAEGNQVQKGDEEAASEQSLAEDETRIATPTPEIMIEDTTVGEASPEKTELPADQNKDLLQAQDDSSAVPSSTIDGTETEVPSQSVEDLPATPPPSTPEEDKMPPSGPELDSQRELRKAWDSEWTAALAVISGASSVEPVVIDICQRPEDHDKFRKKAIEDQLVDVTSQMERQLKYSGWEMQGMDLDEEEEDAAADAEGEEEEEEAAPEEEEDPNRSLKKSLGDTNYFCPVALKENFVLWPGNPDVAGKYRERTYYFSSPENREKFLSDPPSFLPKDKPFQAPPIRLLILGPRGSGKSLHGRNLARKLGLFHIQFRERLQELIIAKSKKKIGPEYEEDEEEPEPDIDESEDEDEGAITGPDGETVPVEKVEEKKPEEAPKGEEEEEEINYTEEEEAIVNYLKEDEPLPIELLDKIVATWWEKEPFKNTGFIIEGFPRTPEEASYLAEKGLFPDGAILLMAEDSDILGRLLPPKLDKWKKKRDWKLERKRIIKEKKEKKRKIAMDKRRIELQKEIDEKKAERKAERLAERGDDSEVEDELDEDEGEEEEEDDIEAILAAEFEEEEEEEEEDEETEEDATDRMSNELAEVYDNDTNRLAAVQEKLEEILIPRIELDAGRKPPIVRYQLAKRTRKIIQFRHSIFERVYPINEVLALKMLRTGFKQPSRFGRWCPVQLAEGDCIQPMQGPGYPTYPAIYRNYIYFMATSQNRDTFMHDPMTYLTLPSPKPVVPIRLAIIGPPKSGKTTLAKRFADEFGLIRLSAGEAVRSVIDMQPKSALVRTMNAFLYRGRAIPDELVVQCIEVALSNMQCSTRGYILDGFPLSKHQVDMMTQRSIIPVRVLDITVPSRELVNRATIDRYAADKTFIQHDSAQIFAIKLAAWHKEIEPIRTWYQEQHSNLVTIEGQHSKWWVWNKALETAKESVVQIQTYLQRISEGKAASIADMCITPHEFVQRLGDFDQYCPVSLADGGELVDCSTTKSLKYGVEFRGHYYKTCGDKERDCFLKEPEKYVPPLAPRKLPSQDMRPKRLTGEEARNMFPKSFEIQGYCPVTFLDGKLRYEAIVAGDPEMVVLYREKLYSLQDEEKLQKFMRLPENYWNLILPHKLPPKKKALPLSSLPMLGYMEQTVAATITKSLTAVGNFKPKYPFLTPTRSALVYVAYNLKANNPRNSDYIRKKYKRKLVEYENTCKLINYLGDNMTRRYKDPQNRPEEFDFKLEMFIQLKDKEPTSTWVA